MVVKLRNFQVDKVVVDDDEVECRGWKNEFIKRTMVKYVVQQWEALSTCCRCRCPVWRPCLESKDAKPISDAHVAPKLKH